MLKHLYLIFIATFIFGFFAGIILYLQNNTGQEDDTSLFETTSTQEFTVLGYMYGGCARVGDCPSYQISNDGSYIYIAPTRESGKTKYENVLSRTQRNELRVNLEETNFEAVANAPFTDTCPTVFDGVGYRYDILYNGERYTFDSCKENFESEFLFDELQNYFTIFSSLHGN